jgi:hypothetical protein
MRRVVIEIPVSLNETRCFSYIQACIRDSTARGEAAIVCFGHFTEAARAKHDAAKATVVYFDRGITSRMQAGIDYARSIHQRIDYRSLNTPRTEDL